MIFDTALAEMTALGLDHFGPTSFQEYARGHQREHTATARWISVQGFEDLAPELRDARTMVFRLGSPPGQRHTHFALAKVIRAWSDYFFLDDEIFSGRHAEPAVSDPSRRGLLIFEMLPEATETSFVNFAIASGILHKALRLDDRISPIIHATSHGTHSLTVRPHRELPVSWNHHKGQVEIDAVFIATRGGVETLFVVESKVSKTLRSLAKHKLAYPMLAIEPTAAARSLPVVGVYLRVLRTAARLEFCVAECQFPTDIRSIDSLEVVSAERFVVHEHVTRLGDHVRTPGAERDSGTPRRRDPR